MKSRNNTSGWLLTLMSALFTLTAFTACASDRDTAEGAKLDPDRLEFDANGGSKTVKINKGKYTNFGVSEKIEWLSFENTSDALIVTAIPNEEPDSRNKDVKVLFWNSNKDTNADNDKDNDSDEIKFEGPEQKDHLTLSVHQDGTDEYPLEPSSDLISNVDAAIRLSYYEDKGKGPEKDWRIWAEAYSAEKGQIKTTPYGSGLYVECHFYEEDDVYKTTADMKFLIDDISRIKTGKAIIRDLFYKITRVLGNTDDSESIIRVPTLPLGSQNNLWEVSGEGFEFTLSRWWMDKNGKVYTSAQTEDPKNYVKILIRSTTLFGSE